MPDIPRVLLLMPFGPQVFRAEWPNRRRLQRILQKVMNRWRNERFSVCELDSGYRRLKLRFVIHVRIFELRAGSLYVFLHEQQLLHSCKFFGIGWMRKGSAKVLDRQASPSRG